MRNIIYNILIFTFLCTPLLAQHSSNDGTERFQKEEHRSEDRGLIRVYDDRYEGVVGSPFLFEKWPCGYYINENGNKIGILKLNYDAYKGELIAERKGEAGFVVLNEKDISSCVFEMEPENVKFVKVEAEDGTKYLELVYEQNEVKVLKHHVKILMGANFRQPYSPDNRSDQFVNKTYYFVDWGNGLEPFKLNKGSIKKTFKAKPFNVEQIAEMHNFNFKEEKDVVNLFKLYAEAKP